jgi:hypothetical protein
MGELQSAVPLFLWIEICNVVQVVEAQLSGNNFVMHHNARDFSVTFDWWLSFISTVDEKAFFAGVAIFVLSCPWPT